MRRSSKLFAAGLLSMSVVVLAARVVYSEISYIFNLCLRGGDKTSLVGCAGLAVEESVVEREEEKNAPELKKWLDGVRYANCYIHGYRDTDLYGQVFLQQQFTDNWVLVVHGYGGSGSLMEYAVKEFHDRGFNVVVPDLRCHGKSKGEYIGMGWLDRMDIIEWCNKIIKGNVNAKIVLYGVSMGAASVLMAAGENIPKNIVCAVSDCSFDSVAGIVSRQIHRILKMPAAPVVMCLDLMCSKKAGYHLAGASVVKKVKKIRVPVLFIHGDKDELVPVTMVYKLYNNAVCKKDLLIIHGAGHGVSAMVEKNVYWSRVFDFVKSAL